MRLWRKNFVLWSLSKAGRQFLHQYHRQGELIFCPSFVSVHFCACDERHTVSLHRVCMACPLGRNVVLYGKGQWENRWVQYDTEIYWPWATARSDQGSTTKMIGFDEARSKQKFDQWTEHGPISRYL